MNPAKWTACETLCRCDLSFSHSALKSGTVLKNQLFYHKIDTSAHHNQVLFGITSKKADQVLRCEIRQVLPVWLYVTLPLTSK